MALCHTHDVDILILAESEIYGPHLLLTLNKGRPRKFCTPFELSPRLSFFIRYPSDCLKPVSDGGGVAIRRFRPPVGLEILLGAMHLPSKLHYDDVDQMSLSHRAADAIQQAERRVGHARTVVVGDLNMNPFEPGVAGADGFHGIMDKRIARRGARTVQGKSRRFFYNPMWGHMGDASKGPPGTYYYDSSKQVNLYWHTFDQVMVRPDLLDFFPDDRLEVLAGVGDQPLLSPRGTPDKSVGSDHLPLLFDIEIEKGI